MWRFNSALVPSISCLENLVINVILADRKLRCSNQRINMLKIVKEDVHR
jgi:hypothetical protein